MVGNATFPATLSKMPTLMQTQVLPVAREILWGFVSTPLNLNRITPPDMAFEIIGEVPENTFAGQLIEYRIKIPVIGRTPWTTEIMEVVDGISFVDCQRKGPYKSWVHRHFLEDVDEGTKMTDEIHYLLPFGIFGQLAHLLFVKRTLARIFQYRREQLKIIFPDRDGLGA